MDRDRASRAKAKTLYAAGAPWGEAMTQAVETHCLVLWQTAKSGKGPVRALADQGVTAESDDELMEDQGVPPMKRMKVAMKKTKTPKHVCPDFSSPKGCTKKAKDRPQGFKCS